MGFNTIESLRGKHVCGQCGAQYDRSLAYCISCGTFDTIMPHHTRPADNLWNKTELIPASKLIKTRKISVLDPYSIPYCEPCLIVVTGRPGSYKSTMVTKIADQRGGPVLYDSLEEGTGDSIRLRLKRLEILKDDLFFGSCRRYCDIEESLDQIGATTYVLDSITVSNLQPRDLSRLGKDRSLLVIAINQVTKRGEGAGSMELQHDADILIETEEQDGKGFWETTKNRFGELTRGEV